VERGYSKKTPIDGSFRAPLGRVTGKGGVKEEKHNRDRKIRGSAYLLDRPGKTIVNHERFPRETAIPVLVITCFGDVATEGKET